MRSRCREFSIPIPINIECNRDNGEPLEFIEEVSQIRNSAYSHALLVS